MSNFGALKAALVKNKKPLMVAGAVGTAGLAYVVSKHQAAGGDGTGADGSTGTGAGSVATGDVVRYDYVTTTQTPDQVGSGVPGSKPNRPPHPGKPKHPGKHHHHKPGPKKGHKGHKPKAQHPHHPEHHHHKRRPLPVRVTNWPKGRKRHAEHHHAPKPRRGRHPRRRK